MKIAILADTHWGVRGDSPVFYKFFRRFFEEVFFPKCEELGVEHVIHLGDVFDKRKVINVKTAAECRKIMIEPMIARDWSMDVILGNHDVFYKDTNDVNSVTELLGGHSNIFVFEEPSEVDRFGEKFLYVPWINSRNYHESMSLLNNTQSSLVFGHLEISGFQMYRGKVCEDGMSSRIFDRFEAVFSGHFHKKSTTGPIWYLGSVGHYTWQDHGDPRGFHILDTETREITFIENTHDPFWTIDYDDSYLDLPEEEQPVGTYTFNPASVRDRYVRVYVKRCGHESSLKSLTEFLSDSGVASISVIDETKRIELSKDKEEAKKEDMVSLIKRYAHSIEGVRNDLLEAELMNAYEEARKIV